MCANGGACHRDLSPYSKKRKACTPATLLLFLLPRFFGNLARWPIHRLLISTKSLICGRITLINSEKSLSEISPEDVRSGRPAAIAISGCRLKFAVPRKRRTVRTEWASIRNELPVKTTQSFSRATLSFPILSIAFASQPKFTTSEGAYVGKNSRASD